MSSPLAPLPPARSEVSRLHAAAKTVSSSGGVSSLMRPILGSNRIASANSRLLSCPSTTVVGRRQARRDRRAVHGVEGARAGYAIVDRARS
jgi:hypothetical protein